MSKLATIFGLNSPKTPSGFEDMWKEYLSYIGVSRLAAADMMKAVDRYSEAHDVPTLLGVEIEVENITKELSMPNFWIQEMDGSLRNSGREFKSVPLRPKATLMAICALWQVLFRNSALKPDFSWRTSIHVHMNALNLEEEEFKKLLLLSLVFESLLFEIVGSERYQSPYCVPLSRSTCIDDIRKVMTNKQSIKTFVQNWANGGSSLSDSENHNLYKYAAVNFARLIDLGTVEFRHLGGTSKLPLILMWVAMLAKLYESAVTMDFKELHKRVVGMNSLDDYDALLKDTFGKEISSQILAMPYDYAILLDSTSRTKECLIVPPKWKGATPDSAIGLYARTLYKRQEAKKEAASLAKKLLRKVEIDWSAPSITIHLPAMMKGTSWQQFKLDDVDQETYNKMSKISGWSIKHNYLYNPTDPDLLEVLNDIKGNLKVADW